MSWNKRERGGRSARPGRRHQTTVRWSDEELLELQGRIPPGMTLAAFVRRSALDRVDERSGEDRAVRGQLGPVRDGRPGQLGGDQPGGR
jgi:hypothetical protein